MRYLIKLISSWLWIDIIWIQLVTLMYLDLKFFNHTGTVSSYL